jgi:trigger factor
MKTTVTELPESRVRVEAQVGSEQVREALERAARQVGKDMRMPGFRRGKIPPAVVLRRVGREALLDEAVRGSLGRWYVEAIDDSGVRPIGDPSIDLGDLPADGEPLTFSFDVGVLPRAELGEYKGLEVAREAPDPDDEAIDAEIERLRERAARLDTVPDSAARGDYVVIDYAGSIDGEPFAGGEGHDQLVELGAGRLIPGFEDQLEGAAAGEERAVEVVFPDDYGQAPGAGGSELAGRAARFEVVVKEVKRRSLPDLDDAFAEEALGFETLAELRDDVAAKLREAGERRAEAAFREAALDAAVANATVVVPAALVEARARELWERMLHQLSHQGISKETYLGISGKAEEEIVAEAAPDAEQALRREAVLRAVIEAEGIAPGDGDVLDALQATAARDGQTPERLRQRLEKAGRLDDLRDDLAQRAAVDLLAESARPIAPERAAAREKIWTPDQR